MERDADLVREIRKLVASEGFTANPVKPQPMLPENLSAKAHSVSSLHDEQETPTAALAPNTGINKLLMTPRTAPRERQIAPTTLPQVQ